MNRLTCVEPQHQGAGERPVIWVVRQDLAVCDDLYYGIRINSALEHAFKRVAGKV
jgi:hypothetical protein